MRRPTNLIDAERYSLAAAAQKVRVHVSTVARWALRGVRGRKLKCLYVGGRKFVLADDLEDFVASLNADSATPAARPPSAERRAEHAERELDRHGL